MATTVNSRRDFRYWVRSLEKELPKGRSWTTRIGERVNPEVSDHRSIRRNLTGSDQTLAQEDRAYAIGEAFRLEGVSWCSGLYALFQHDDAHDRVYEILDIIAQKKRALRQISWAWLRTARLNLRNEILERNGYPSYDAVICRNLLRETTDLIHTEMNAAWQADRGIDSTKSHHGIFSEIRAICENPNLSKQRVSLIEHLITSESGKPGEINSDLFLPIINAEVRVGNLRFTEMIDKMIARGENKSSENLNIEYDDIAIMFEAFMESCFNSEDFRKKQIEVFASLPPLPSDFPVTAKLLSENGQVSGVRLDIQGCTGGIEMTFE